MLGEEEYEAKVVSVMNARRWQFKWCLGKTGTLYSTHRSDDVGVFRGNILP